MTNATETQKRTSVVQCRGGTVELLRGSQCTIRIPRGSENPLSTRVPECHALGTRMNTRF